MPLGLNLAAPEGLAVELAGVWELVAREAIGTVDSGGPMGAGVTVTDLGSGGALAVGADCDNSVLTGARPGTVSGCVESDEGPPAAAGSPAAAAAPRPRPPRPRPRARLARGLPVAEGGMVVVFDG